MKKYILLILFLFISVYFNTGCNPEKNEAAGQENSTKYKSGTVYISDDNNENSDFYTPQNSVGDVQVGPGDVKFGPEDNF